MKDVNKILTMLILPGILCGATLHLKSRDIRMEAHRAPVVAVPGPRWTAGRSHLMLGFRHALNEALLQELNGRGAFVVGALPDFGVMVSVPDGFSLDGLDLEWTGRLENDDKISPLLETRRRMPSEWFVAEFFPDVDMAEARRLAEAAGFQVHERPDLAPQHLLLSGERGRLNGLAQWDEVAYVFPASGALIRGEHVHTCIGALSTAGTTPMYVAASTGWPKDSAGLVTLSYYFSNLTPKLPPDQAAQAILSALNAWTQYAPIKFVPGSSATAPRTVNILFAVRDHNDGFPFDGPGGILAHTFYPAPPNPESIAGDMHFDGDEDWHIGANTDLFTVAIHEAGHALGLAHVDDPAALMYPYYRLGSKIASGDIAGVQSIYGSGSGSAAPVNAPPALSLTITSPAANYTTSASTVTVLGTTANVSGTVKVTWQTDHGASGTATGGANWSVLAAPLAVGSTTITVTATDGANRAVQSVTVNRMPAPAPTPALDHTPPTISISSPAGQVVTTTAGSINIAGIAADNVGVTKVTWQCGAASGTATGTTNWSVNSIPLLVGNNTVMVRAWDAAANSSWRSVLVIRN